MNRFLKFTAVLSLAIFALVSCEKSGTGVQGYNATDKDMNQAYADARATVEDFIHSLDNPVPGQRYLVKFSVEADGEVEHMWGEPVTYDNGVFKATLVNEPAAITSISVGAPLEAPKDEISDWAVLSPSDKILAGGYTLKVMMAKEGVSP